MKKDKCYTKFCRGEIAVTYLGKPYCQKCYINECEKIGGKIGKGFAENFVKEK